MKSKVNLNRKFQVPNLAPCLEALLSQKSESLAFELEVNTSMQLGWEHRVAELLGAAWLSLPLLSTLPEWPTLTQRQWSCGKCKQLRGCAFTLRVSVLKEESLSQKIFKWREENINISVCQSKDLAFQKVQEEEMESFTHQKCFGCRIKPEMMPVSGPLRQNLWKVQGGWQASFNFYPSPLAI